MADPKKKLTRKEKALKEAAEIKALFAKDKEGEAAKELAKIKKKAKQVNTSPTRRVQQAKPSRAEQNGGGTLRDKINRRQKLLQGT